MLKGNLNDGWSIVSFFVYMCNIDFLVCLGLGKFVELIDKVLII